MTCSDDSCHRIWRIGLEHKIDNEELEIRGKAETVSNANSLENLKMETTPTTFRRYALTQEHTPGSDKTPSGYTYENIYCMDNKMFLFLFDR